MPNRLNRNTGSTIPAKIIKPAVSAFGSASNWAHRLRDRRGLRTPLDRASPVLGSLLSLETRLARSRGEIRAAQALRYKVFYEEMSAIADAMTQITKRDKDSFDRVCDHLLVVDKDRPSNSSIVATYRLLRQEVARQTGGFYSEQEFDLSSVLNTHRHIDFLELGRSCVLPPYRSKRTIELLWQGTWAYVLKHNVDVMIGCASLEGTNPEQLAQQLSFLHHKARAPESWRVRAQSGRGSSMKLLAKNDIDDRLALKQLPPLIKGYLRLGAWIGEEAVVDHQFGTTDVLIILPVANINHRYINYYGADASRYAA